MSLIRYAHVRTHVREKLRMRCCSLILLALLGGVLVPASKSAGQVADTVHSTVDRLAVWALEQEPRLQIGSADGPRATTFMRVVDAVELSTGEIVVADQLAYEVRFFDRAGEHLGTRGRRGGGPGEFESLVQLLACASTPGAVLARDGSKLVEYSADSLIGVRQVRIDRMVAGPARLECAPAGGFVALSRPHVVADKPGVYRPTMDVAIVDRAGHTISRIGPFAGQERERFANSVGPRLLGRGTVVALTAEHIFIGNNDGPAVNAYDYGGRLAKVLHWRAVPSRVTQAMKDSVRAAAMRSAPPERRTEIDRYLRSYRYPEALPYYRSALTDPDGRLWIEQYPSPGARDLRWLVFDRDLRLVAQLEVPASLSLYQVGPDWVLGVGRDEMGVERVLKYGFRRTR